MASYHPDSASSGDEDAPETVSLAQSKKTVKKHDDALKQIHAAAKEKKKLRNKERDRWLKEQAQGSKKRQKDHGRDADLQTRMERAMQDAEAMDERSDSDEEGDFDEDEFMGIDVESGESSEEERSGDNEENDEDKDDDDDDDMDTDEDTSTELPLKLKINPSHLPDHLFTSAFSTTSKSAIAASKRKASDGSPARKPRKRVRSNAPPKDVLIGSRAVRTLTSGLAQAGVATLPSAKVRKFLDRNLALKGNGAKKRGWERRPANLGVMRREGPASSFVRNR